MTEPCWCGDAHEPRCPTCEKCGAPITTGFMAFICPRRTDCHFWPAGETEDRMELWLEIQEAVDAHDH